MLCITVYYMLRVICYVSYVFGLCVVYDVLGDMCLGSYVMRGVYCMRCVEWCVLYVVYKNATVAKPLRIRS